VKIVREFYTSAELKYTSRALFFFIASALIIYGVNTLAINLPEKIGRLNDYANVLRVGDHKDLENKLDRLSSRGKGLTILISLTDPYNNPGRYGFEISRKWGIYGDSQESLIVFVKGGGSWHVSFFLTPSILETFPGGESSTEYREKVREKVKAGNIRSATITSIDRIYFLEFFPEREANAGDEEEKGGSYLLYYILGATGGFLLLSALVIREARIRCPECGSRMDITISHTNYAGTIREKRCPKCGYYESS